MARSAVAFEHEKTPDRLHLQLVLFDDLETLPPHGRSFIREKPSWLHADEDLPEQDRDPGS